MRRYLRYLPPILWMGVIFYLSSVPNLQLAGEYSVYDAALRKVAHVVEFGVLYLLWYWALDKRTAIAAVITILYALSDELHQSLVSTRTAELSDLVFDTLGVGLAILIGRIRRLYPHRPINT